MKEQRILDTYYNNYLVSDLEKAVPEFDFKEDDLEGPYIILHAFGRFLEKNYNSSDVLKRSFDFISMALLKGSNDTLEVINLEIFYTHYETKEGCNIARYHLSGDDLRLFKDLD